jgi:hypothetical protein
MVEKIIEVKPTIDNRPPAEFAKKQEQTLFKKKPPTRVEKDREREI